MLSDEDKQFIDNASISILSALISNSNVVSHNSQYGWGIRNSNEKQLASYACKLASALFNERKSYQ